ncbi:MAG: thermonuclease family protein [Alphaproteobacteria bacterium]
MRGFFTLLALLILLLATTPAGAKDMIAGPIPGKVLAVLDGDTITVRLHIWIGQHIETHVRLAGIDTPEIKGKCAAERMRAAQARRELEALLANSDVTLSNIRLEKYAGRVLADATNAEGVNLAAYLKDRGLARAYGGKRRLGWCE